MATTRYDLDENWTLVSSSGMTVQKEILGNVMLHCGDSSTAPAADAPAYAIVDVKPRFFPTPPSGEGWWAKAVPPGTLIVTESE